MPDFDDYFRDRPEQRRRPAVIADLLFETSRGCWWGAKSHCTFCGLNGGTMAFRSKVAARAVRRDRAPGRALAGRHVEAVDNILDMKYFDSCCRRSRGSGLPGPMFYEVKANLKRQHVAAAGARRRHRIQPGIESLSDHVLS